MTDNSHHFRASNKVTGRMINEQLPSGSRLGVTKSALEKGVVLDTFDGTLREKGILLAQVGSYLICVNLETAIFERLEIGSGWNRFAETLPESSLRDRLDSMTKLRVFLPLGKVAISDAVMPLLDEEEKTCCRLESLEITQNKKALTFIQTRPMRGYDKYHTQAVRVLESLMTTEALDAYHHLDLEPSEYSTKPPIALKPEAPAVESLRMLVSTYLGVARKNESGIVADYDTEYLHDYRVSLRKVRSVLSLFKNVLSLEETTELKQFFADVMKETNLLRDRDVYLLSKADYFAMVPPRLHAGLETLFTMLADERKDALKSISSMLKSQSYKKQMADLETRFRKNGKLTPGELANAPSKEYGCGLVMKRYRKVCRIAESITEDTPDETIHELRIQCKKLRYLIESFAPLFPTKEVKALLKKLKKMQEHLGLFNDRSVQQASLEEFMQNHSISGKRGLRLAESIGALTSMLYTEQLRERAMIIENLAAFGNTETRSAFNHLFDLGETI